MHQYLFKSERLGFRNWRKSDLNAFAEMNADEDVMEFFPKTLTKDESKEFIDRTVKHYENKRYNYFAIELLKTNEFIGFIGMGYETYDNEFYPATNIGWRLKKSVWGKGYATEGAKRCIDYAFTELKIDKIAASCIPNNINSEKIMKKIGMIKKGEFIEPRFIDFPGFEKFVFYEIKNVCQEDEKCIANKP